MPFETTLDPQIRLANFESLQQSFYYETGAVGAARLVRSFGSQTRLAFILRDHKECEVSNLAEIHLRDLFDDLLNFYSLVEIGSQIATLPDPLPRDFRENALRVLNNSACKDYYTRHYPITLPQALLRRLEIPTKGGEAILESGPINVAIPRYQELLAFDLSFRSDPDINVILRLLDGFHVGGVTLDSLLEFAKSVANYQAAVSSKEYRNDARGRALRGFGKLVAAMLRLDNLLADCNSCPLMQSSISQYYQYWIKLAAADGRLLDIVSTWKNEPTVEDEDVEDEQKALAEYIEQIQAAIQRLTSLEYRRVTIQ